MFVSLDMMGSLYSTFANGGVEANKMEQRYVCLRLVAGCEWTIHLFSYSELTKAHNLSMDMSSNLRGAAKR